jgi:hypothetical protein
MASVILLASKTERAVRALLILAGKTADAIEFQANGDCFVSNDSRSREVLPNRTCVVVTENPLRKHRPESIVHLQIQHHLPAILATGQNNLETERVNADQYVGDTVGTMTAATLDAGGNPIDNDDEGLAVAQAVTACGQWLATPDPNQQDPATAAAEAQIVANNKDMATFRMDWIRRANPFHTRGHDTSTDHWVEILHFEAGVSYATVPNT